MDDAAIKVIKELKHALEIAEERAVMNGNRLVKLGSTDMNRGQFQSVVKRAIEKADSYLNEKQ